MTLFGKRNLSNPLNPLRLTSLWPVWRLLRDSPGGAAVASHTRRLPTATGRKTAQFQCLHLCTDFVRDLLAVRFPCAAFPSKLFPIYDRRTRVVRPPNYPRAKAILSTMRHLP